MEGRRSQNKKIKRVWFNGRMIASSATRHNFADVGGRRTHLNAQRAFGGQAAKNMYYTYILLCIDSKRNRKKFYAGSTGDLRTRLLKHKTKSVDTTKSFDKIELIYYEACRNKTDARKRELQLKTGFGRGYINKRLANDLKAGIV